MRQNSSYIYIYRRVWISRRTSRSEWARRHRCFFHFSCHVHSDSVASIAQSPSNISGARLLVKKRVVCSWRSSRNQHVLVLQERHRCNHQIEWDFSRSSFHPPSPLHTFTPPAKIDHVPVLIWTSATEVFATEDNQIESLRLLGSIFSACHSSDWTVIIIIIISTNQQELIRKNESKRNHSGKSSSSSTSNSERRKGNKSESDRGKKMREIASAPCCTPSAISPSSSSITRQTPRRCRRRMHCECWGKNRRTRVWEERKSVFMDEQRKLYLWPRARSVLVDAWLGVRAIFLWLQFATDHGQNKAKEEKKEKREKHWEKVIERQTREAERLLFVCFSYYNH